MVNEHLVYTFISSCIFINFNLRLEILYHSLCSSERIKSETITHCKITVWIWNDKSLLDIIISCHFLGAFRIVLGFPHCMPNLHEMFHSLITFKIIHSPDFRKKLCMTEQLRNVPQKYAELKEFNEKVSVIQYYGFIYYIVSLAKGFFFASSKASYR